MWGSFVIMCSIYLSTFLPLFSIVILSRWEIFQWFFLGLRVERIRFLTDTTDFYTYHVWTFIARANSFYRQLHLSELSGLSKFFSIYYQAIHVSLIWIFTSWTELDTFIINIWTLSDVYHNTLKKTWKQISNLNKAPMAIIANL